MEDASSGAGSGLDSGSGWRGRWMKEKADGWMGTDGPSALNCIKWQTDETQQELLGRLVRQFRSAGARLAGRLMEGKGGIPSSCYARW